MIEIIHVSDLHFGKSWWNNHKAKKLLKKISNKYSFNGDDHRYLLVTGDITQGGREHEYKKAAKALAPFVGRIFITPGNHDYGAFFGTEYSEEKAGYFDNPFATTLKFDHEFFDKKVYSRLLQNGQTRLLVIGLNSNRNHGIHDFAQGEIGTVQLAELEEILSQADPSVPKLVFLHHIPYKDADVEKVMNLRDWPELQEIIKGRVDAIAFGHQGVFIEPDSQKLVAAQSRALQIMSIMQNNKKMFLFNANSSVKDQSYYHIKSNGGNKLEVKINSV